MRRVKVAAVGLLAAAVLAGCGGPSEGTVIEKDYDDPDTYMGTCYRTEYRTVPVTTTVNGKTTTRMQQQSYQQPYSCQQYDPAHYRLYLREEVGTASSRDPQEGWKNVNERVYMACKVGNYYEEGKCR